MHVSSPSNPLRRQFDDLAKITEAVAEGRFTSIAVSGAAGLGKTYTVTRVLKKFFGRDRDAYEVYSHASTAGLIQKLWERRDGGILILDDADHLLIGGGDTRANLLKKVLSSEPVREITYDTQRARDDDTTAPPRFTTRAQIIWIGNTDLDDPPGLPRSMVAHLQALRSRLGYYVRMSSDPSDVLDYVLWLAMSGDVLKHAGFKLAEANDAVGWFVENARQLQEISIRRLLNVASLRRNFPDQWERMARDSHLQAEPRRGLRVPPVPTMGTATTIDSAIPDPVKAPISAGKRNVGGGTAQEPSDRPVSPPIPDEAVLLLAVLGARHSNVPSVAQTMAMLQSISDVPVPEDRAKDIRDAMLRAQHDVQSTLLRVEARVRDDAWAARPGGLYALLAQSGRLESLIKRLEEGSAERERLRAALAPIWRALDEDTSAVPDQAGR